MQARPWRQQGRGDQQALFPAFDSRTVPDAASRAQPKAAPAPGPASGRHQLLRELQSMVNGARKAETRLARAQAAKERTQAQWQLFLEEMKESYMREQRRFYSAMERHEKEVQEANAGQEQVYGVICSAAFGGGDGPRAMEMESIGEDENAQAWDQMVGAWDAENGSSAEDVLRRALGSALGAASSQPGLPAHAIQQALNILQPHTPMRGQASLR